MEITLQFQLKILLVLFIVQVIKTQDLDIVNSCTNVKKIVFDEEHGFSFLLPNAPITVKKIDKCKSYTPLIVGGKPAEPKEFAPMARLGNRNDKNVTNWFCGGTLINNRVVLTAAHCLYSDSGAVNVVRLGDLDFATETDDADPEDFGVQNITEHPDYKYPDLYNDIALLKLDRGVRFNVYKHPACLPFDDGSKADTFTATGWGDVKFAGRSSTRLLKVKLDNYGSVCPTASDIDELPNGFNVSTQLCIGSTERKDTCNGDSGGPALGYHADYPCMYHVMGITSIGIGCGEPNKPTIYTRVHFYLDWIKLELSKFS